RCPTSPDSTSGRSSWARRCARRCARSAATRRSGCSGARRSAACAATSDMATAAPASPPSQTVAPAPRLRGRIAVPGDKSITHRALMYIALARGSARVDGFLDAADTRATIACLRALGARIDEAGDGAVVVHGAGRDGLAEPEDVLDCGNSGTTMRLLA